jgi:uncharacterized membrane protein YccC
MSGGRYYGSLGLLERTSQYLSHPERSASAARSGSPLFRYVRPETSKATWRRVYSRANVIGGPMSVPNPQVAPSASSEEPSNRFVARLAAADTLGLHLAVNIFVATTILWLILRRGANTTPIWAIASMVAVIDPQINLAYQNFRGRILNTLLGCFVGLTFLMVGGSNEWKLPLAMSATVLLSSYVFKVALNWRIAPTTAALIIASSLAEHSRMSGAEVGARRVGEVILGCMVGIIVTWTIGRVWRPPPAK